MNCKVCGKIAPELFGSEWINSKWMVIMKGASFEAVFCPDHHNEGDQYWKNHCKGLVNIYHET